MRTPLLPLASALVLSVLGCAAQEPQTFEESYRVPHPVGAYENEYFGEADVVYTVDDVSFPEEDRAAFTVEVEVPDLRRVLGFGEFETVCESGGVERAAEGEITLGETEAGSYAFPMECDVAPGSGELRILVRHDGEEMVFTGPVG
ncbi:hypothetical protein CQJ94_00065 [Glycomyces fuscus]|nr:hypothetical protein CQJ94_00065 [Glycomyces fuscus]